MGKEGAVEVWGVWVCGGGGVRSKFGFARMAFGGGRNPSQFRLGGGGDVPEKRLKD